ncbi:MAG: hypothetical protein L3J82_09455, partial [Planctomycetes bacterium]|nr:hypothetical protein [Planctomycetota bacterium]
MEEVTEFMVKMEEAGDYPSVIQACQEVKRLDSSQSAAMDAKIATITADMEAKKVALQARIDKISKMKPSAYNDLMYQEILKNYPNAKQNPSGLVYIIENPGES